MDDVERTLRAVVDTVVPADGPGPSASSSDAHGFVAGIANRMGAETTAMLAGLLDASAATVRTGCSFTDLAPREREGVVRGLVGAEDPDLAQVGRLLVSLTLAAVYGEYAGLDDGGRLVRRPPSWDVVGYPGPSTGHPLRRRA